MFTSSGDKIVKCLESFSWKPHSLLALLKSFMNFETVLKGAVAVVSFFDPCATLFWKAWGVLDTNLVPGAHDPLVSVEAEVETNRK